MTEITDIRKKPDPIEAFILQWGDLGATWGVNRSVSQIHALLYLAELPMTAEDIAQELGLARSNVSNSLKELLSWRLISKAPQRADRRDHFVAETDMWKVADLIATGRKAREIDPALAVLRDCALAAKADPAISKLRRKRLEDMLEFTQSVDSWANQMLELPSATRARLLRLGAKIARFLPKGREP